MTMQSALPNYIRSFRLAACFSQKELAMLVGCRSHTAISRFERFETTPDIVTAAAIAFVFGVTIETAFPKLVEQAQDAVMCQALLLLETLEASEETVDVLRKREVLYRIPRCDGRPNIYPSYEP